jgi:hypothetical protein
MSREYRTDKREELRGFCHLVCKLEPVPPNSPQLLLHLPDLWDITTLTSSHRDQSLSAAPSVSSTDFQSTTTGVLRDMQDLGSCSGHWPRAAAEGVREPSWASIPKLSWRLCDLMSYGGKPFGCHADRGYANAPYPCKNRRSLMGWLVGPSGCVCPVFTRHDYMILHRSMMIHVAVIGRAIHVSKQS